MSRPRYYVLDGHKTKPVDMLVWAYWFSENGGDGRRVATDLVGDVRVSTVFIGIDMSFRSGPAILFETMIFGGVHDEKQWRYATWDDAVAGHERALYLVREMIAAT